MRRRAVGGRGGPEACGELPAEAKVAVPVPRGVHSASAAPSSLSAWGARAVLGGGAKAGSVWQVPRGAQGACAAFLWAPVASTASEQAGGHRWGDRPPTLREFSGGSCVRRGGNRKTRPRTAARPLLPLYGKPGPERLKDSMRWAPSSPQPGVPICARTDPWWPPPCLLRWRRQPPLP